MSSAVRRSDLDARYGRTPARRRLSRVLAIVGAALGAAAVVGWAVWSGALTPKATLEAETVAYEIVGDHEVLVRYSVNATPGNDVVCAIAAQNEKKIIVGYRVVEIPASEESFRVFEQRLITSDRADVGLMSECRLA